MTRDSVRGRGAGPFERGMPLQPAALVAALIVAGVVLRFLVAGLYLPLSGFRVDVGDFTIWSEGKTEPVAHATVTYSIPPRSKSEVK